MIAQPEVYKSSHSDVYIVFGEAKAEDMSQLAQAQAAQQMAQAEAQERLLAESLQNSSASGAEKKVEEEEEDDDSPIDEEGVDAKDIDLVMQQVSCSRRKAVKALKESNGDLINAIMNATGAIMGYISGCGTGFAAPTAGWATSKRNARGRIVARRGAITVNVGHGGLGWTYALATAEQAAKLIVGDG